MSIDERNFRSAYYEKVGFKSVEEKKSLEILLKDQQLECSKLKLFCLRFSVTASYRKRVWKLLLGVLPMNSECHEFVMDQRRQEYHDLLRALQVMRMIDSTTPKPQQFFAMWLLQFGKMHSKTNINVDSNFIPITQTVLSIFDDEKDTESYWVSKCFYDTVLKFEGDIPKLIEISWSIIEREESILFKYLYNMGVFEFLPLEKWFGSCFAEILHQSALVRIWDKICGGSYKILVFVFAVMVLNQKHCLIKATKSEDVLKCLSQIPEKTADVIVTKSIEMWQHNGSPLTVYDKPKPS
ncbi:TBC1 domain family member 7 [Onthophagus taurus]|uniref:TBC1 domain family member 7 n=1 Tax=Onthophagus taurus TaxID=166361 RepID=UPI000C20F0D9|nr:TBC1 domain family member 7 [Onthophagus taurus]